MAKYKDLQNKIGLLKKVVEDLQKSLYLRDAEIKGANDTCDLIDVPKSGN